MRMDLSEIDCCFFCGESFSVKPIHDDCYELQDYRYMLKQHEQQEEVKHYPTCHKVHLECANKKIDEIRSFLETNFWDCYCDGDGYDPQCGEHGDGKKWLESLGEK